MQNSPCASLGEQQGKGSVSRPDPSPVAGLYPNHSSSSMHIGMRQRESQFKPEVHSSEVPVGATDEDLKLLNRFIDVASGNFGGNKLSSESETRVRAAAHKIGLTPKFVDQILKQQEQQPHPAGPNSSTGISFTVDNQSHQQHLYQPPSNHHYHSQPQVHTQTSSAPYAFGDDTYLGETSTYYSGDMTRTTKRTKKKQESEDGCNVWDTWDNVRTNIGYALAKACGTNTATNGDDESSISSTASWDENTGTGTTSKRQGRRRRSGAERGRERDSNRHTPPQPSVQQAVMATPGGSPNPAGLVTTPSNQSLRGYV